MREMKNSGIEWIGEIPKEWKTTKMKYFVKINSGEMISKEKYVDNGIFPIIGSNGEIGRTNKYNNEEKVITTGRVGTFGTIHIVKKSWITDNVLIVRSNNINQKYLSYIIVNFDFKHMLSGTAQPLITSTNLKNQYITFPPLTEQQKLSAYLDTKCTKIDSIIEKQEKVIEKLKEYKLSVITEAVTKGLNPDVKMKDSGVEWIGEIPEHWEMIKIKYLGYAKNGLTYNPQDISDNGVLVLRSSNIVDGNLKFEDNVFINIPINQELKVKKGDILICSRNGSRKLIGKNALIKEDINAYFGAFMMIFRTKNYNYIHKILNSNIFNYYLGTFLTSTINQLTLGNFNNMIIPYTNDTKEQEEITKYLDKKCSAIDSAIEKKQAIIEKLKEYKKSLIYEVVTGKREV